MRLILFFVGTISAVAICVTQGVIKLPPQMVQAFHGYGGDPLQRRTANFNPVDAYNHPLPEILRNRASEDVGLHIGPVTKSPMNFRSANNAAAEASAAAQNGFASGLVSKMQQNNLRAQDMARNPAAPTH